MFALFAVASGIALAVTLRRRQAWVRRRPRSQWALGWGVFAGIGVAHAGFAVLVLTLV